MADSRRPTIALIGFGGSGAGIHAPIIAATAAVELSVIVTHDAGRTALAKAQFPEAEITDSLVAAEQCDVAVVALPVAFRGDMIDRLVARGVRVVVEKPFAADLAAAEKLATMGADLLAVFHNRRWDSDFLTLKKLQAQGVWSGPVRLTSRIQRWQPAVRDGWRNRPDGGGFLREVGTHQIDQVLDLLGPAASVYAEVSRRRSGASAEDEVFLAIKHVDGSRSHLISGALGNPDLPRFDLASERTLINIGTGDPQQDQLAAGLNPHDDGWGVADTSQWWVKEDASVARPLDAERGWWPGYYEAVAEWAHGGAAPVTAADGVATMAVIEAARQAAEQGTLVDLDGK